MKKSGLIFLIIGVVVIVFSAGLYVQKPNEILVKNIQPVSSITPSEQIVVGGDRDSHGCIGSAGYTWCEEKQKCLRTWEEQCVITVNDEDDLKTAIKQAIVTKRNADQDDLVISVSKREGNYAQGGAGSVTPGPGGGMWFGAKVNGVWKLVWDGNGIISCNDLIEFPDFPTGMVPECYDEAKQAMKIR